MRKNICSVSQKSFERGGLPFCRGSSPLDDFMHERHVLRHTLERITNLLPQGEAMKDYGVSVLEQYQMDVYGTRRIRGAVLCDTDKGLFLLKEARMDKSRLSVLTGLYGRLNESGFNLVDTPFANKEGEFVSTAEDGTTYMVKRWFLGRECDVRKESELLEGARHLAKIHLVMEMPGADGREECGKTGHRNETLAEEYSRHNRELRKVRAFVCKRSVKNEFEIEFLKGFDQMYRWAQGTLEMLEGADYGQLYQDAVDRNTMIHGDYNYHNLLFCPQGLAVTEFEHAHQAVQLEDFYYFLRKSLEKHHYDERLGYRMLRAYDSVIPLGRCQRNYLAFRLAYPEKFWKIANLYYHSGKSWIPAKNVEKLKDTIQQSEEKKRFLANLFAFHL